MPEGVNIDSQNGSGWNAPLRRLVFGHLLAAAAEWAVYIAAFVYAYNRGGAAATGLASVVLLATTVLASPLAGLAISRLQPNTARLVSLVGQAVGFLIAGVAATADLPLPIVLVGSALVLSIFILLRPSQAVLIPLLCERPRQLTTANLWVGHSDSGAALLGPLATTGLMLIGGPALVFLGFGAALVVAAGLQVVDHRLGRSARAAVTKSASLRQMVVEPFKQLRARGGLLTLIALIMFQYALVGALDILFVVIALETLGLDQAASSLLTTFFGIGAVGAVALSSIAHRSGKLAVSLSTGMLICGAVLAALALFLSTSTESITPLLVAMPLLGAARFLIVVVSRALLQRSADDDTVGSVFALMEIGSGIGILAGSLVTQLTLAISGPALTLQVFAIGYGLMLVGTWRAVRQAESSADVPIVEMGLLRNVPAFAPLPPMTLETVARQVELVEVEADTTVISQGERGDRFYAVMNGSFEVTMSGRHVRTAKRGGSFGEVALLANVDRTATVRATETGALLAIEQEPFMRAITSHDPSRQAMWSTISEMDFDDQDISDPNGH